MRWLRPFSSTTTSHPASVRMSATLDPPGPLPTTTASQSRLLTRAHLDVGPAAGLHVAVELDGAPSREVAVAAVDGVAVHALARVDVEKPLEGRIGGESSVLLLGRHLTEVRAEGDERVAVSLLVARHRPVELAFGDALRAFDARAPRE